MSTLCLPVHQTRNECPTRRPALPLAVMRLDRFSVVVKTHRVFVWRMLRRFGVAHARVDEAVSSSSSTCSRARRTPSSRARSARSSCRCRRRSPPSFVASDTRRTRVEEQARPILTSVPTPEELLADSEERAMLDAVLLQLDDGAREALRPPRARGLLKSTHRRDARHCHGNRLVASLRRGRKQFEEAAARLRERLDAEVAGKMARNRLVHRDVRCRRHRRRALPRFPSEVRSCKRTEHRAGLAAPSSFASRLSSRLGPTLSLSVRRQQRSSSRRYPRLPPGPSLSPPPCYRRSW